MLQVLHNPRCGKSRNCLAFLKESQKEFEIINYLENPLSTEEIKTLLKKLNYKPIELVRQKETIWKENFKGKSITDDAIIDALAKFPILIERPIVVDGEKAIIGREIQKLNDFI
ncbi:arsenate reductase family protein [Flavobacterium sp. RSB2_4_14]|uniref:arsenate reductase family protein n=1 Tax=Flavobacterium sp. RSB2_4_14 TaxID=3447665 RepID=UPI003F30FE71